MHKISPFLILKYSLYASLVRLYCHFLLLYILKNKRQFKFCTPFSYAISLGNLFTFKMNLIVYAKEEEEAAAEVRSQLRIKTMPS